VTISFEDFLAVDIRAGTVTKAEPFPEARKPAYKLTVDFGPDIGVKVSSAQITSLYSLEELVGRQVLAVVNFPTKKIGPFTSEVLVLGLGNDDGDISLIRPDHPVPDGSRMH
jgi:tRNA-binding protein